MYFFDNRVILIFLEEYYHLKSKTLPLLVTQKNRRILEDGKYFKMKVVLLPTADVFYSKFVLMILYLCCFFPLTISILKWLRLHFKHLYH